MASSTVPDDPGRQVGVIVVVVAGPVDREAPRAGVAAVTKLAQTQDHPIVTCCGPRSSGLRRRDQPRRYRRRPGHLRRHPPQMATTLRRPGLAGLKDLPRPGRAATFTPVQKAEITALACSPPEDSELPLARWSHAELAAAAIAQACAPPDQPRPPSVAGWPPTRSSPGSTGHGSSPATPTSRPKPAGCWTCTPAAGRVSRSARTTM
jgi:hypothetical protein